MIFANFLLYERLVWQEECDLQIVLQARVSREGWRENIMLNIVVINCDGKYVEYEWTSKETFVEDMESDSEISPMLDDALAEVNTQDDNLQLWWENTDGMTVDDLLEECKQELCR